MANLSNYLSPPPIKSPIIDPNSGTLVNRDWAKWFALIGNATAQSLFTSAGYFAPGAGSFAANGTKAASLGALAPSAANASPQEWLIVQGATGQTRYIPCF